MLDQRIKDLENDGKNSSKELYGLIFKRAAAFYSTAVIKDYEHNTETIKQAFSKKEIFNKLIKYQKIF